MKTYQSYYNIALLSKDKNVWEKMGWYIYRYVENGIVKYIGKGKGDRAFHHLKTKEGFTEDQLEIVMIGLSSEEAAYDLECYMLSEHRRIYGDLPEWNKVAGHHEERFIMTSYLEYYNMQTTEKKNKYRVAYDLLEMEDNGMFNPDTTNKVEIKDDNIIIESVTGNHSGFQCIMNISDDLEIKVFRVKFSKNAKVEENQLKAMNYFKDPNGLNISEDLITKSNAEGSIVYIIDVKDLQQALSIYENCTTLEKAK